MAGQVAWIEVIGQDTGKLRGFYSDMFGWTFDLMEGADYGIVSPEQNGTGGGIGAGPDGMSHQTFYVSVDDVQAALDQAESLGGTKVMGPMEVPGGSTIGMFTDPEGHSIGVVARPEGEA